MNRVPIVGCGDIGWRVARLWREEGVPACALARSSQSARRGTGGAVDNVSDGQPGTIAQYYCAVADLLGVPRPPTMMMAQCCVS